jgi:hypothetical protein
MRIIEIISQKLVAIFCCLLFTLPILGDPKIPEIPVKGKSVQSFVPKGWKILSMAEGDINKDSITDIAIVLKHKSETSKNSTPRILLVLLGDSQGYVLQSFSKRAIMKLSEGGSSGDPFSGMSIEKGKLIINHNGGNRLQWGYSHVFEFRNENLYLISKSITEVHVSSSQSLDLKVNLVSGRVLKKETDRKGEKKVKAYKETPRPLVSLKDFAPYE